MAVIKNIINNRYGMLVVKQRANERTNSGQIKYICLCDCGKQHIISGECLRSGKTKSCGCYKHVPTNKILDRKMAVWRQLYNSTVIKKNKKRNIEGNISFDDFLKISNMNCHYCGREPSNYASDLRGGKYISDTKVYYNGLDRIESNQGYTLDNVYPCCKFCNCAKNTMSENDFFKFINQVYKHLKASKKL